MSPNITSEPVLSFASRQTVAGRKEALELRKTMKPLIEKKRRARVNYSLDHLKTLIFPLTGKDNSRCSKLEKADILEMTVNFLSDIPAAKTNGSEDRYKEGYKACLQRVSDLLPKTSLDKAACQRIDDFIQRSMPVNVTPACQNCCAQSIRALPQIQQRLLSLKSHLSPRSVSQNSSVKTTLPNPAQDAAQATDASMWRPW